MAPMSECYGRRLMAEVLHHHSVAQPVHMRGSTWTSIQVWLGKNITTIIIIIIVRSDFRSSPASCDVEPFAEPAPADQQGAAAACVATTVAAVWATTVQATTMACWTASSEQR